MVSKGPRVPHFFTLLYALWSNGSVERLGKELFRVFRSVLYELRMHLTVRPDLLPLVQSALNNALSTQRGIIFPITVFTGMNPYSPISTLFRTEKSRSVKTTDAHQKRMFHSKKLQKSVAKLHLLAQTDFHKISAQR